MKTPRQTRRSRAAPVAPILSASILALSAPWLPAATETWNVFTGTANWALDSSWLDGTQPLGGDPTLDLIFGATGAQTYTANNDILGLLLNTLTFTSSSTSAINLTGNALDFRVDGTPPAIMQTGTGAVNIANEIIATDPLTFGGTGTGLITVSGIINGAGSLVMSGAGRVLLNNVNSSYAGGTTISSGVLEVTTAVVDGVVDLPAFAPSVLGNGGALTINGGQLKVSQNGTGPILNAAAARVITFGANGGTLNLNGRILNNGASTFSFNLTPGVTPVIAFNGGVNGVSSNNPADGNWVVGGNSLRISAFNNAGLNTPVILEATNGATIEMTAAYNAFPGALTFRGVAGGDPTGQGFERNTGRFFLVAGAGTPATYTFPSGLFLEDTMQFSVANALRRIDAPITVRGTASGHAGNIGFAGRATGTALVAPQGFPLLLGNDTINNRTITIEGGGTASFDARIRTDQTNMNGVQVTALTDILAGGTVKVVQSWIGTGGIGPAGRPTGYIELQGDVRGSGTAAAESVLEIQLPFRDGILLPAASNEAGATFNPAGITGADLIVNGSSAGEGGGLRILATPRNTRGYTANNGASTGLAFADTGAVNVAKLNSDPNSSILAPTRLAALTGTGGYLTIGAVDGTVPFPVGGEWGPAVPVGLKVINSNATGDDVSLSGGFQHNINVAAGATLNAGGQTLGPAAATPGLGLVQGTGAITGGVTIAVGGVLSPGFGLGTLMVGNLTLDGAFLYEATNVPASDLLTVAGNLTLGATSFLSFPPTNTFANSDYTLVTYSGALTGTFGSVPALPAGFVLNYGTGANSAIKMTFTSPTRVWNGNLSGAWNTTTANWQGGGIFAQSDKVVFDDTAAGPNFTVTVTGGNVQPNSFVVSNTTRAYTIISTAGAAVVGSVTLIKSGTGTLTLSGPAAYTGGTQIDAGLVRLGANNSLPDTGAVTIATGATLDPQGNTDTIGMLTVGGTVMGPGTLTVGNVSIGSGGTIGSNLVLSGDVTKTGAVAGTITGTINLGGAPRTFTVDAGAVAPDLTLSGALSNGGLTKAGAGELVLATANSYTGPTTVNAGRMRTAVVGALPAGNNVTVAAGAVIDSSGIVQSLGLLTLSGSLFTDGVALGVTGLAGAATGVLDLAGGALTVTSAGTASYAGAINGIGSTVTKNGTGTQHLTGFSNYDGVTTVNAGILGVGGIGAAGTGPIVVNAGTSLDLGAAITNVVNLNGGLLGASGGPLFQGTLNALVPSTLRNADPENLNAESELDIRGNGLQGTADLFAQTNNGDGSADQGAGIRLRSTLPSNYSGTITVANTTKFELQASSPGPFSPMGTGKIKLTAGTFTGGLQGTYPELNLRNNTGGDTIFGNDLEVIGSGIANLNPLGSAPVGARIGMGNLRLGAGHTLAVNRNAGNNLIVAFTSATLTGGEATFSPTTANAGFTGTSDLALGPISELAPSSIVMSGTNSLFLEGANTYTGGTTVQSGTVRLGAAGALPVSTTLNMNGGTLDLSHPTFGSFDQTIAALSGGAGSVVTNTDFNIRMLTVNQTSDTTFAGQISAALGLTKKGPGKLQLDSFNTHTGPTDVQAGAIVLGPGGSLSGSTPIQLGAAGKLDVTAIAAGYNIATAQTLSGSGDWDGRIVLDGTLAPGPSIATLSGDNLTLNGAGIMQLALSTTGNTSDKLTLAGSFDKGIAGAFQFDFEAGGALNQTYTLVTFANSTFAATDFTFTDLAPGLTGSFQMTATELRFVAIPEPGSAVLLLSAMIGLAGFRRRR